MTAFVPTFLKEGPATACILQGHPLGWTLCTCLSCAMLMDRATLGHLRLSGCQVRSECEDPTGKPDVVGGTTIPQVQAVATAHHIATDAHVGSRVASLWFNAYQARTGRPFLLQGNTQPDGRGNVNHAVASLDVRGGTGGDPDAFLIGDPWSRGFAWWSYAKVKAFAQALHPYGETDPRTLKNMGVTGVYSLIFPDTEPHALLHYGGQRTSPFPDTLTIHPPVAGRRVNVRSRPDRINPADVIGTLGAGKKWNAHQVTTTGVRPPGSQSRVWYGNDNGDRWIHSSGVVGVGGPS